MPRKQIDWDKVDWSKTNWQLAFQLGYHAPNTIATKRRELKKPPAPKSPSWMPFRNHTKKAA